MIYWIIASIALLTGVSVWIYKFYLPTFIKGKAQAILLSLLFPGGKEQQAEVMKIFHQLTNQRFNDEQVLDYFVKIKGLQTLDLDIKANFWIKKYLLSPTDVKLNYFEQVKFYETFMNYPKSFGFTVKKNHKTETSETLFKNEVPGMFLKREYA